MFKTPYGLVLDLKHDFSYWRGYSSKILILMKTDQVIAVKGLEESSLRATGRVLTVLVAKHLQVNSL